MIITDLRGTLSRAGWSIGNNYNYKAITTVHWTGTPVTWPNEPEKQLEAYARFHIQKDWNPPNGAYGDGIMYHYAVAQDGRVFQCRDETAILYNTGAAGNYESISVLCIVGEGQSPTQNMLYGLDDILTKLARPGLYGHRDYGTSFCPGNVIYNWLQGWPYDWGNDMVTEAEVQTMIAAYGARLQPELEVDRRRIDRLETFMTKVKEA